MNPCCTRLALVAAAFALAVLPLGARAEDAARYPKPVIDAELTSADERAGVDPVLRAIARYVPLRAALADDLRLGDPDGIARVVRRYASGPTYRYANFEDAINRLG